MNHDSIGKGLLDLSSKQQNDIRMMRWKCRIDLGFLCREVLNYPDVSDTIHAPILNILQKFPKPDRDQFYTNDELTAGGWKYTPLQRMTSLPGGRRVLILDPRGWLKCLGEQNELLLDNGEYITVRDSCVGQKIAAIDESFNTVWTSIEGKEFQGLKDVLSIKFRSGREIQVTPNHPLRLVDGWRNAEDIQIGDRVPTIGKVDTNSTKYLPDSELTGWLLGDGSMSNQTVTNINPYFRERIINAATRAGGTANESFFTNRTPCVRIQGLRKLYRKYNLLDKKSGDKFVPKTFFSANLQSIKELLYGLYMSDGTWVKGGIKYTSKSRQLVQDIQRLLLHFDIFSSIYAVTLRTGPYAGNVYYSLVVSSIPQIKRFVDAIGWDKRGHYAYDTVKTNPNYNTVPKNWRKLFGKYLFGRDNKPKYLTKKTNFNQYDISKDKLLPFAKALNSQFLVNLCQDDLYWDTVIAITPLGTQPTWDIQTEHHTLAVSDVITHNTTINAQAHSIQWVLNYPDIAIMIIQSNLEKGEMILGEIKRHFQYNPKFRMIFPDHCPFKNIDDFGTKGKFTTRARDRTSTRKEETFSTSSIDAGTAGIHVDVMKFSDIVEPSNTGTVDQMESVTRSFYMAENLLVGPNYWIDVEGTRYDFGDCYGRIIESQKDLPAHLRSWRIHARGCYQKDKPDGVELFTPEELDLPAKIDENGHCIPHWLDVERGFTYEKFEEKRLTNPFIFSSQQLNSPQGGVDGRETFPVSKEYPAKIKREDFTKNVRVAYYEAVIDTAEAKTERANYSCISIVAFANDGRVYVNEIIHGKFLPDELVDKITELVSYKREPFAYGNKLRAIKIEETPFVRGLAVALKSFMHLKGIFLPLEFLKRDNQISKQERIQNSLQPYYMNKRLIFLDDIKPWDHLIKELRQFPKGTSDDILDTLADIFQGKEWFGREVPKYTPEQARSRAVQRWLGVDDPLDSDNYLEEANVRNNIYFDKTGGL